MTRYETWLDRAKSSLEIAKTKLSPIVFYEDLCFQAQQSAEKALKGLLIYYNEEPAFTHNIHVLLNALSKHIEIPVEIRETIKLTKYAVFTRYPGEYDDVTKEEYEQSIILSETCLDWVEQQMLLHEYELCPKS
jgi:HEPN domain-containing protein